VCPAGLISSQASTLLSECKLPCPAGQFSSNTASNVARMCGAAQNEACPAQMSSVFESHIASNGNDGNMDSMVHSSRSTAPIAHVFNIDFEQVRNIESVKFFNQPAFIERITGAEIRIGSNLSWEDNTICATLNSDLVQTHNCNLVGRHIFIIVSAARAASNIPLNFMEIQAYSACTSCPATAILLPGSTSSAACGCPAGSFEETRVLNPPYIQRKYSSIFQPDNLDKSLLDDIGSSWSAQSNSVWEWMEIETGQPIQIVEIILQSRGGIATWQQQYVTEFRVEYRLGDTLGVGVVLPGTFSMINGLKKEHIFPAPIYARYIRIVVLQWNGYLSMRAALIVKSCSTCFSNAFSLQGSTASSACECLAGAYKYTSAFSNRAIVLVPGRGAQFSTLANRNQRLFEATAMFDSTAGPPGSKGAVTFDRGFSQYLDGGTHTFNVATNGGFTIVSVVKFSGAAAMGERILDFGKGTDNDNVIIYRYGDDKMLLSQMESHNVTFSQMLSSHKIPGLLWWPPTNPAAGT